jgi:integrase
MAKLTVAGVNAIKETGRYADGQGLYLVVAAGGSKSWVVRMQKDGRRRDVGLGGYPKVALAAARRRAAEIRTMIEDGRDPVAERKQSRDIPTFLEAAKVVHGELRAGWSDKTAALWLATLEAYAFPALGSKRIDAIEPAHVRDLLAPIWFEKPETAKRVFQRVATVLDWGFSKGFRSIELPKRSIAKGLGKRPTRVQHHAALPYADVPAFMDRLQSSETAARLALAAAILTAARSGEIRGARWSEVDLKAKLWTVPAGRMKMKEAHVVPLSPQALAVFQRAAAHRRTGSDLVFPSPMAGKVLSDMALTKLLRDMGETVTAHGFRSSFRDWAAEQTGFPGDVVEKALAHSIRDKVEAAYRRGDLLEKRRALMAAWGGYCAGAVGKSLRLVASKAA